MKYLFCLLVCAVVLLAASLTPASAAEFRGFWVDSWGSGFENPTATTTMINYVDSCKCNAVLVEIRKRGDAYYDSSYEPTATSVTPQAGYDCLADIVTKAHNAGLEVHAWVVVYRVWTSTSAPPTTSPNHVFNAHPEWFSQSNTGATFYGDDSFLDPGHPGVENHLTNVFMEIVSNYDIDGLCLDYIRYPATTWGYNPTVVARYNAEYGLSGSPSSTSTQWCNWRRDQVSNMVKRTYLEAKAIKPNIKIGAAVWNSSATGSSSYFANWDLWMTNHWLDYASPMAYTTTNSTFNGWVNTYTGQQHGRHVYPAQGSYMNTISNSMTQINYVRSSGLPGSEPYDYRVTNSGTVDRTAFKNSLLAGPYATTQSVPTMTWISSPTLGMLKGFVRDSGGNAIYPATVTIQSKSTKNSGTGFYGFTDLSTGSYTVTASADGYNNASANVTIVAGHVTTANLTLTTGGGGNEIVIDNGSATYSGSWSTGTSSSDKYGSDYRFANTATSETAWARWTPNLPSAGAYDVYVWYPQGSNRSTAARYTIYYNGGSQLYQVNQTTGGGQWNLLDTKTFAAGTSGYVKLGNGTSESSKVVMADAVKFAGGSAGDTQAPTTPTNLTATAVSSSQINLSWSASSDNVGVTGYNIYRDGGYLTSVSGTSYSNTGLASNTTYTYRVSAYDAAGNESSQSTQASATTFSEQGAEIIIDNTSGSFSCSANWAAGTISTDKYGTDYRWRSTEATTDLAIWTPNIELSGTYAVYAWWPAGANRSTTAPYQVYYSGGSTTIYCNQQANGGQWNWLTTQSFGTGTGYPTRLSCWTTAGYVVVADAVRWLKQ